MSFLCYYAVQQIALGDAIALVFSAPLFTLFLEWLVFSGPRAMLLIKLPFVILLLLGVVLVVQPSWLSGQLVEIVEKATNQGPTLLCYKDDYFQIANCRWKNGRHCGRTCSSFLLQFDLRCGPLCDHGWQCGPRRCGLAHWPLRYHIVGHPWRQLQQVVM